MAKNLLSIQYPPFQNPNFGLINLGHFGFNIFRCDLIDFQHLVEIENITVRDYKMKIEDFDAILIINADFVPFTERMLFPEREVKEFRSILDDIRKRKNKEILFIGFHGSVPSQYALQQAELFDGLFISATMSTDEYKRIYQEIQSFVNSS